jgi:ABC-type antimicrobial peptide transport system permease subunit
VGAIITVILLLVVLIGVYIPARAASRVNPVDALRDE